MRIKSLFWAASLAAVSLTSCNKEDGVEKGEKLGDGSMRIVLQQAQTRVGSSNIGPNHTVSFSEGAIVFTNDAGEIFEYVLISESGSGGVKASQLEAGYTFTDISENVTTVHVFGNYTLNPSGGYLTVQDIFATCTEIVDQNMANGGIDNVGMYGSGEVKPSTSPLLYDKEADVPLESIVARIELDKISATLTETITNPDGTTTTNTIAPNYNLAGIYINNTYYKVELDGKPVASSLINNGQIPANYQRTSKGGQYDDAWFPYLFEDNEDGTPYRGSDASGVITPESSSETWAFNLFAGPSLPTPHIILHLTGVTLNGTLFNSTGVAYLTVSRYLADDTTHGNQVGASINLAGNNVYRIRDLNFKAEHLSVIPEPEERFSVNVTVTPMEWDIHLVSGGIDKGQQP